MKGLVLNQSSELKALYHECPDQEKGKLRETLYLWPMKIQEILKAYQDHKHLFEFGEEVRKAKGEKFHIKGMVGSQPAFLIAALWRMVQRNVVIILNDKEEALYFHNDLQQLLPKKEIFLFPASYKRPYQVEQVDNANVLQRAEVLNELNHTKTGRQVIVTFAEALNEKVINKRELKASTFDLKKGENIELEDVVEILEEYKFEREEFVFEPGQYAWRGGILDVFSFAHDLPYRIEFFGDEIDSIRTFDPVDQRSIENFNSISILPNVQQSLIHVEKVPLLEYISDTSLVFIKNIPFVQADLDRTYEKAEAYYLKMQKQSGGGASSKSPEELYLDSAHFLRNLDQLTTIEFNPQAHYPRHKRSLEWKGNPQPTFKKEFSLLADHLKENSRVAITNCVLSNSPKQLQRLEEIFEEIDPEVAFQGVTGEVHEGFLDPQLRLACYTDHQIFQRYHRYKVRAQKERSQAITLKELRDLNPGDFVTHISHGIGKFAGLHTIKVGENIQEAVKIMYQGGDAIFVNVNALHKVAKYTGKEGTEPKLHKLGTNAWARAKAKTKKRLKELAFDLVDLYAKRKAKKGFGFTPDGYLQRELEASFMYEDTPDQLKTTEEVKADLEKPYPMDRLVCGDVGFGKTEIAIRAAFKASVNGKQTAVLVPTTILALQHYKTFKERLEDFPVKVDYVNRFKSSKQIKETLKKLAEGEIDILIGTHRLVSKDVKFKDLGLMVVDEEQKFGVGVKEKLKLLKAEVDTLTLTATPIPRTLQFSLLNIRDLSVIQTPPPNRQPIETIRLAGFNQEKVRDAISYELKRGGQVYFIHPRVQDMAEVASSIKRLVPDARVAIAHGQMTGSKLEQVMADFIENTYDVLVATKIVESGLDISNANTILINQANMYGLAELHQMRGRVGRANRKAFCYLIAPPDIALTEDARKRLNAMEEFTDLGSGFHIALRDLDIRGAGDLLGPEQSGFIGEIGYDVYHKILDEAIRELKQEHFGELFADEIKKQEAIIVEDCQIDLDLDARIPQSYVPSTSERLNFYRRIAGADKEDERQQLEKEMLDRFGPIPEQLFNLLDTSRIRQVAMRIGLEKVVLKKEKLRLYFVSDPQSIFYESRQFQRLIEYVQTYSAKVVVKQSDKYLSLLYQQPVETLQGILERVQELHDFMVWEEKEA
jgi:transcription-repair coupling factor (superfamily II helicase)